MTLSDWQSAPKHIAAWRELMASPVFVDALSVLDSISPAERATAHPANVATDNACVLLGQIQGYKWTLQNLRMLAQPAPDPAKQPVATYGAKPETP